VTNWGCYRIQVRGPKKWSTLSHGFYYGDGYQWHQESAEIQAGCYLKLLREKHPDREYRIDHRPPSNTPAAQK
jgi:hypothetical protein